MLPATLVGAIAIPLTSKTPKHKLGTDVPSPFALMSRKPTRQSGVVTARGNVQMDYPARQIQATAAQAQYFSKERRIVLSGNVYVLQQGNSMRGETITYLIDEGRFVALPKAQQQVESIYLVSDPEAPTQPVAPPVDSPLQSQACFQDTRQ
jgi:lipopolysaccharide export system protein LptA